MWEGGGIVYQLTMFIGALGMCFIGYLVFISVVGAGMQVAINLSTKGSTSVEDTQEEIRASRGMTDEEIRASQRRIA